MEYKYISSTKSIGGRIKQLPQDFIVEEVGDDYFTSVKYLPDKKVDELDWKNIFENKPEDFDYLILDLEKINTSTTSAISQLSRFLRVSKKRISYAGLKDKRAISSQKVSIYQPELERISKFYFKNIKVYNPIWSKKRVDIGDLKQNKFTITIRKVNYNNLEELKLLLEDFISQINNKGVLNYFGEQRFGGLRQITHKVGKLFLEGNFKDGILLYLCDTFEHEKEEIKKARLALKEDLDFSKHAAHFPIKSGYETAILNYLANNSEDFLGALKVLPKSIQFLFTHAYQSYIFNKLINLRLEKGFGIDKIDGDTIINNKINLPLFGFNSSLSIGQEGILEREVLKSENIDLDFFKSNYYSVLSSKGDFRELITKVYDLKLVDISEDELNLEENSNFKKIKISFILDKGQYATNILRELIKPKNIDWY